MMNETIQETGWVMQRPGDLDVTGADDLDVTTDVRRWLDLLFQRHRLSPAHRRIARFLLEHPDQAVYLTAGELGQRAQVSQPSVTRFAVTLGFAGYPELRDELRSRVVGEAEAPAADSDADVPRRSPAGAVKNGGGRTHRAPRP